MPAMTLSVFMVELALLWGPQYYISDISARLMLRERNSLIRYQQQDRIEFRMHIEPGLITMRT